MTQEISADYLVVGAGATALSFVDTLIAESDAKVIMVDREAAPGGHWNHAYPFVTLHQPSAYYGVQSKELSKGFIDTIGLNQGLMDLAPGSEILAYFDEVMRHTFLPSGQVQYFPKSHYEGDGVFRSLLTGKKTQAKYRKLVDTSFLQNSVPSTHVPKFEVADGVKLVPINALATLREPPENFVILGAGKTGVDACLWLLKQGVDPGKITWIMPRDAWYLDRKNAQPTAPFFHNTIGSQAVMMESLAMAESMDDAFDRLESSGYFLRLHPEHRPSMFHGATISSLEIEQLQRIKNVVRQGRVKRLNLQSIELEQGQIPTSEKTLHVDCTATAIANTDRVPVFQENLITPQMIRAYQPLFSASLLAHFEVTLKTDAEKNKLAAVATLPNHATDFFRFTAETMMNQYNWGQDKALRAWLKGNRLDGFSRLVSGIPETETEKRAVIQRIKDNAFPAMMKLQKFIEELDEAETQEPSA